MTRKQLLRYAAAIIAGNAIYFTIEPHLPPRARHAPFQLDWGLAVDFWICLACWGVVRVLWK